MPKGGKSHCRSSQRVFDPRIKSHHYSQTWGSSGTSKEVKFFKELTFLGFVRYFSAKIEQSSKMSKTELKNAHLGRFFEVSSILAEK